MGKIREFSDDVGTEAFVVTEVVIGAWLIALLIAFEAKRYGFLALLLAPVVLGFVIGRVFKAHTSRKAAIRKARDHTRWPKLLKDVLWIDEGERVEHEERMHPAVIIHESVKLHGWKLLIPVALIVVPVVASFKVVLPIVLVLLSILIGLIVLGVQMTPAMSNWYFTRRCFTNIRVIEVTGIRRQADKAIKRAEIRVPSRTTEVFYNVVLRFFGLPEVCHWTFDTVVQEEPFRSLMWSRFPSPSANIIDPHDVNLEPSDSLD